MLLAADADVALDDLVATATQHPIHVPAVDAVPPPLRPPARRHPLCLSIDCCLKSPALAAAMKTWLTGLTAKS